jgi:ribulose-phosphate 3-epimerase
MAFGIKLAPSILSADFSDLRTVLDQCVQGGADYIHIDVMDNHFVPNLTIGPMVVASMRPHTHLFLDVHLMVTNVETLVKPFARAGADGITFHLEATDNPGDIIDMIKAQGKRVGISIKPGTPVSALDPYLDKVDLILIMSVEPGFGAQKYLSQSTERIRELDRLLLQLNRREQVLIEVDGGIKLDNAAMVAEAGADILVAGSAIFGSPDPVKTIQQFKRVK